MFGLTARLHTGVSERLRLGLIGLAIAAILGLSAWIPSAARAAGCEDSWTNTAGGSWFEGANWSKGKAPASTEEACVTANGTYTVTMDQTSTVTVKSLTVGGTSGTQTLVVASTNGTNAVLTTSSGITNGVHGAITLTNSETNGNNVTVVGPINNAGTLTTEPAHGGQRNLQGNLTNTGTLQLNTGTSFNSAKAALTNEGTLNLATGAQLVASNESSIANGAGGKIAATGTGNVFMEPVTSFTQGAGTTSGAKPVILRDAALHYTGSGESKITQHGEGNTLSGNLSTGQSLVLESTNSENQKTTASASFTSAGTITLTKSEANDNNARLNISSGTLTNSGTITSEAAENTGHRFIEGSLTNTGTLNIDSDTEYNASKATLTNEGTIALATGAVLFGSNEASVVNASGAINATGTGVVFMEPGTSFTQGAGTTSGAKPVILRDAALHYTGSGESKITQHGEGNTLSGNLSTGQSLVLESTNSENQKTTASGSFTNAGTITLTKSEANDNNARLNISSGTLTNSGTITSEAAENTGHRFIEGSLTNTGTLNIDSDTEYNASKAALTNEGTLNVAESTTLDVSNDGTVTNGTGGKIAAGLTGNVFLEPGSAFTQGAGTTSGAKPVILRDAALHYTGSGESKITQHGEGNTLSGNLSTGQSLVLESTNSENQKTTASGSFTNAGTITLTKSEANDNNARLNISSGTLTNSGTITSEAAENTGHRFIEGSLTNTGTLNIDSDTEYNASKAALTNEGTLNVAESTTLDVSNDGTVTNGTGGKIAAGLTGNVFLEPGSAFTQGAGTTSGALPVIVRDGVVKYVGSGASTIAQRGEGSTLSGTISGAHQMLVIESACGEHTRTTAPAGFTSSGTIALTNSGTCGNNATLSLSGKTLTNKGTIDVENPHGGVREIEGSLQNEGTLSLGAGETLKVTGTYAQTGKGTFSIGVAGSSSFGALSVTGTAKLAGALAVTDVAPFVGIPGESLAVLSSSSRTGKFSKETGAAITKVPGLYYKPTYTAKEVTLLVTQATLTLSSTNGLPGSLVTISGSNYLPGDTITLAFMDHGVRTVFPTVKTESSGEFSTEITISNSAAVGSGSISVKATHTGVTIKKTFKVT